MVGPDAAGGGRESAVVRGPVVPGGGEHPASWVSVEAARRGVSSLPPGEVAGSPCVPCRAGQLVHVRTAASRARAYGWPALPFGWRLESLALRRPLRGPHPASRRPVVDREVKERRRFRCSLYATAAPQASNAERRLLNPTRCVNPGDTGGLESANTGYPGPLRYRTGPSPHPSPGGGFRNFTNSSRRIKGSASVTMQKLCKTGGADSQPHRA